MGLEDDTTVVNKKRYRFWRKLREEESYRRRFTQTMFMFWNFFCLGWVIGQIGPSFPDLQLIVNKNLDDAAWIFTTFSMGFLVGSLIVGIFYNNVNRQLRMALLAVVISVSTAFVPRFESFSTMLVLHFVTGLGGGGIQAGGNAELLRLWGEKGRPYMQVLQLCNTLGGTLSPLALEPFLSKKLCTEHTTEDFIRDPTHLSTMDTITVLNGTGGGTCVYGYEETRIHEAYFITALVSLSSAIPFLVMFIKDLRKKTSEDFAENKSNTKRPETLPLKLKLILCILLCAFFALYSAAEGSFSGFLATFCLQHLHWDKSESSFISSLLWVMMSVGRFCGIFLTIRFRPAPMIGTHLVCLLLSLIALLVASLTYNDSLVWLSVACVGFAMSVLFGSIYNWVNENIMEVSGMISSMFIVFGACALMANPLLLSHLMEGYSPMWFIYLDIIEICMCFTIFSTILTIVRKFIKPRANAMEINVYVVTRL